MFYYSVIKVPSLSLKDFAFPERPCCCCFFSDALYIITSDWTCQQLFLFLFSIEFFNFQSSLLFYLRQRYLFYHYLLCLSTTFSTYFRRTLTFQSFLLSCFVCDNDMYFTTSFSICQHFSLFFFTNWVTVQPGGDDITHKNKNMLAKTFSLLYSMIHMILFTSLPVLVISV